MDFRPNVERGMAWLDENRSGWEHRIDLNRLDLQSPCHCLLGQEFDMEAKKARASSFIPYQLDRFGEPINNGYDIGFARLCETACWSELMALSDRLGFSVPIELDTPAMWTELTLAWRTAIVARLDSLNIPHNRLLAEPAKTALATAS